MSIEERLKELGITLPPAPQPLGAYLPCVRSGNLLFLSGILPLREGKLLRTGKVGESLTIEEAKEEARQVIINALSIVKATIGTLDLLSRCLKLNGYIASSPDFIEQPAVLNAASELLYNIFGDAGKHARVAIGVNTLPLNSPIEIDFIFEVSS
ncbi:MAG: RidA family protein [Thermodesulfovibrionales bacterium]